MDAYTHEVRLNQWKLIIEQCQSRSDEQTAKQWLAENGIQEKTYYYWLRRVRKEVYSQLSDGSTSLPAMQEKGTVIFAEVPMTPQQNPEIPFSFHPAVVIKTSHPTVAVSNEVSDRLLTRLLQEVSNA
ncbi:hypothetical protein SAMN05216405_3235 [Lachnospiraceae bacterium NLAE-zl-G231]|nr:hypothetical protein SAMN05216405_3235 [Lachnospiraceae bacterium NLAE-zl-G231]